MWKEIKQWLFGINIKKMDIKCLDSDATAETSLKLTRPNRTIISAKFICKDCGKTVARLKNKYHRRLTASSPLKSEQFQLVKNQHTKNKAALFDFDVNNLNCHHCELMRIDYKIKWEN